jgi:hypothetical protein
VQLQVSPFLQQFFLTVHLEEEEKQVMSYSDHSTARKGKTDDEMIFNTSEVKGRNRKEPIRVTDSSQVKMETFKKAVFCMRIPL